MRSVQMVAAAAVATVVLLSTPSQAQQTVLEGSDGLVSINGQSACVQPDASFIIRNIPANALRPGSEPIDCPVRLQGVPIPSNPPNALDPIFLIWERLDSLFFPAIPSAATVPIQITALGLQSCEPITVVTNGQPERWDVFVTLSEVQPQPPGQLQAFLDHADGGAFIADIPVRPRFVFTSVDGPPATVTIESSIDYLITINDAPWSYVPPLWYNPIQIQGFEQLDGDFSLLTAPFVPLPNSPNFFPGVVGGGSFPVPPCPSVMGLELATQAILASPSPGAPAQRPVLTEIPSSIIAYPPFTPGGPIGSSCIPDFGCVLTDPTCGGVIGSYNGDGSFCDPLICLPPIPTLGLQFDQVDFVFSSVQLLDTEWGRLQVDVPVVSVDFGLTAGYINIYSNLGWVVQNLPFDINDGNDLFSYYFTIAPLSGVPVFDLSIYLEVTSNPLQLFFDGPRSFTSVGDIEFNAQGKAPGPVTFLGIGTPIAPGTILFPTIGLTESLTQPNKSNVQSAHNQCYPMSIANSLQYLEDRYGLPVPDPHIPGLKGDTSLVGKLDSAADRGVTSRSNGSGIGDVDMLTGKFLYLKNTGLDKKLVLKHQGSLEAGVKGQNFTRHGVTSTNESDSTDKVTWQWVCDELAKGEDVELSWLYDGGGGHVVRVFECGKTLGIPWIGYVHDRLQTDVDPMDNKGLECVRVFMIDTDNDNNPNAGAKNREIDFAHSESADTDMDGVTNGIDNAPNAFNPGQEDLDTNGVPDVLESPFLVEDTIPGASIPAAGSERFGAFPNPMPSDPLFKDLWYEGTVANQTNDSVRVAISFEYWFGGSGTSTTDIDTTFLPANSVRDVGAGIRINDCPDSVAVQFTSIDGPVVINAGLLKHLCYGFDTGGGCCVGSRGDFNCDGGVGLPDLSTMIDYLFISFTPLCCVEEADLNIDGAIGLPDLSLMIDHLFITFTPLPPCP